MDRTLTLEELRPLGRKVLERAGVPGETAALVCEALVRAEADGIPSHGFSRLPYYADQALSGKVRADARPVVRRPWPASVLVDAGCGFAFPAIAAGLAEAIPLARTQGCTVLGVTDSHHCGVAGHHVEHAAEQGLIALMCANAPAAMAPWGGSAPSFGTNPLAFACPRQGAAPLVVDLSLSLVARGKVLGAAKRGEAIPEGWALDAQGHPTTNPEAAMAGTMLPMGGAKGAALALIVEILAAALTGSHLAFQASSLFTPEGEPPRLGQFFLLLRTDALAPGFGERLEALLGHMLGQPGVRLPGDRRLATRKNAAEQGVTLPDSLYEELLFRSGG